MLHLKKLLAAKPKAHETAEMRTLLTPWGEALDPAHVLEEHPTPQFARTRWASLNGPWGSAFVEAAYELGDDLEAVVCSAPVPEPEAFDASIVVPFSPEASLSGVGRQLKPGELLWYRRAIAVPALAPGERLIIHFQAVDNACAVYINGTLACTHTGGYLPFSIDATPYLAGGEAVVHVCVADSSELGGQLRGKQRLDRGDIWYTAQSGIWQSVWMEVAPTSRILSARIEPDAFAGILAVGLELELGEDSPAHVSLELMDGDALVASASCAAEELCALAAHVPDAHLWSPTDPHLYRIRLRLGADEVWSYCGFRTVEVAPASDGYRRIHLNGEPLFIRGVLDQGYWPDGLLTAPSDEALIHDIEQMRAAGFNTLRKHIKVETERWYYHCDRFGMLVWQDMPSGGAAELNSWQFSYKPSLLRASWRRYGDTSPAHQEQLGAGDARYRKAWLDTCRGTLSELHNHPCIIAWTLFNEGWGQFDSRAAWEMARKLDGMRPICVTSGWYDQGAGEIRGVHNYFRDLAVWRGGLGERAFVITEFGGFACRVPGHSMLEESYGYETAESVDVWRVRVQETIDEASALEGDGLAGFILTQLSDVEEEVNGILTYDRRVNKLCD